jgi:hypothetical protein
LPAPPFEPQDHSRRALLASAGVPFENAIYQWRQGERRLKDAPAERRAVLERVVGALVSELRRRLGGRFSSQELAELYSNSTGWCLQLAMKTAPEDPWAWEAGVVVDAAFGRYLREASDYAGGRRALSEA